MKEERVEERIESLSKSANSKNKIQYLHAYGITAEFRR